MKLRAFYTTLLILGLMAMAMLFRYLHAPYRFEFAIGAIFQDEAPYLKEWIEFHRIVGAEHFYLYNHESQDDFREVLAPYIRDGLVELVDWNEPDFQFSGQKKAYMNAIEKARGNVKWLAILDLDEFLVPKTEATVPALLVQYDQPGIGGVCVNWQMFGTSHVPHIDKGELLVEKLVMKAPTQYVENRHIKSIVRPEYVVEPPHVHYFEYQEGWKQVDTEKQPCKESRTEEVHVDKIQINHYWTKDEYFLNTVKIPRRLRWGDTLENVQRRVNLLNQIEDHSIYRFLPLLKRRMR